MEGLPGDWIFIDWADGLSKKGEVSFEQLLFCRSLETMALCANISERYKGIGSKYKQHATALKTKIFSNITGTTKSRLWCTVGLTASKPIM